MLSKVIIIVSYVLLLQVQYQLLSVTHTLQVLNISCNDISDSGMAVISEALQWNKSLTKLIVGNCGLSVKGTKGCEI